MAAATPGKLTLRWQMPSLHVKIVKRSNDIKASLP